MMLPRRVLLGAAWFTPLATPALAQSRPLRVIVSAAAGASLDILARAIAPGLAQHLGQPVVVENQGGAGGALAMQQVARAVPDGSTLLLTGDSVVLVPLLQKDAGFALTDFAAVTQAVRVAQILVTHPGTVGAEMIVGALKAIGCHARYEEVGSHAAAFAMPQPAK